MIDENIFGNRSKSKWIAEASHSISPRNGQKEQRSSHEEVRRARIGVALSTSVDRMARRILADEVQRRQDSERLNRKTAQLPGVILAEGILLKRRRAQGPLGKLTSVCGLDCTWMSMHQQERSLR